MNESDENPRVEEDGKVQAGFATGSTLMLGRDQSVWGEFTLVESGAGRTASALSVGADTDSPSMASKGSPEFPNEDALLSIEEGPLTMLVVADAHHGLEASHDLVQAIARATGPVPSSFEGLEKLVGGLVGTSGRHDSASTLLVAVLDRSTQAGFEIGRAHV